MQGVACWDLPVDVFKHIVPHLDGRATACSRSVCKAWRDAISLALSQLQPRLDGSAFSVQLHELQHLPASFPFVHTLDMRHSLVSLDQVQQFAGLPWLRCILLSCQSCGRLSTAVDKIKDFALAFQELVPQINLRAELGTSTGESMSGLLSKDGPDCVSNADLSTLAALPQSVLITHLTLPRTFWPQTGLTLQGLRFIAALTSLESLNLLTASNPLDDAVLTSFAPLAHLQSLHLVNIRDVTDAGLVKGLLPMTGLQTLHLHHADGITDAAWSQLAASWHHLTELSVTHALCLTDAGLASLSRLPRLRQCFISGSGKVTNRGMRVLADKVDNLEFRACPQCV